jgi:hypothetical protein
MKKHNIFLGTISAMVLMFKQLVMLDADLFFFPLDILVALVTARLL